jgi:hypothetical protein
MAHLPINDGTNATHLRDRQGQQAIEVGDMGWSYGRQDGSFMAQP